MSQWIKVEDRPPDCDECLAIFRTKPRHVYNMRADGWFKNTIYACRMDEGRFIIQSHGPILPATHWMPLPEKPEIE